MNVRLIKFLTPLTRGLRAESSRSLCVIFINSVIFVVFSKIIWQIIRTQALPKFQTIKPSTSKGAFMSKNETKPLGRKSDIVIQEYGNEILIYDLTVHKAFSLNETSALVWQACDGRQTVSEISRQISRQLNSNISEDFVWLALEQLKKDNLLENASEISNDFGGLSRREVIRRVGFATLVALPLVSSLVAPSAVNAQSLGTCGGACQCPNATVSFCSPAAGGGTINCNLLGATCRCRAPFGAPGSGTSPGQKVGACATGPT
jgi:hypothetical protein